MTNQHSMISRRTMLKGAGAAVALPMLDAMIPGSAWGAPSASAYPTRMGFVFLPNGVIMDEWQPHGEGTKFKLPKTTKPLEKFRHDVNFITGLAQENGNAKGDGPGDHARSAAPFLTGAHPFKTSGANIKNGISVDQAAAAQIGKKTRLPSLEIGIERGRNAGNCDSGYSCAYSSNISWKSSNTPMAKEINPRLVFERLFGDDNDGGKSREKRNFYRKSILDLVAEDADGLRKRLGKTDRQKMDEYFNSVREIEQRIERAEQSAKLRKPNYKTPSGIPRDMKEHLRLMYDLMFLAFRTDTTRVCTFMAGNAGSNRSYTMVNVSAGWHSLSHHRNDKKKKDQLQRIDQFHVEQFAYLLDKLKTVPEGAGTLLDNCMILYGSGLSDGNRHSHYDLPIILAGKGSGSIKTGRHLVYDKWTPMNNLFLSMLDRVGAKYESIGDSKGRLRGLDG